MRFLFRALTLVFMVALGEAVGDRMRWTRKEMVEIAGYGELKLSSVILTASLLSSSSDPISDKACSIKPLSVPKPYRCSHKIHRGIKLVSSSNGLRFYTAGNITLH
ncbi:hypothetical protein DY000_02026733 [Brassica cretica]|uniref:Uncharacterized protein n=1 Tax=Brassica cretica TaxID=69181 RepID=A0ABQ7EJT0_BRACR|nr:hypothetical protein DY000_02026733 [Brassica cretica]